LEGSDQGLISVTSERLSGGPE